MVLVSMYVSDCNNLESSADLLRLLGSNCRKSHRFVSIRAEIVPLSNLSGQNWTTTSKINSFSNYSSPSVLGWKSKMFRIIFRIFSKLSLHIYLIRERFVPKSLKKKRLTSVCLLAQKHLHRMMMAWITEPFLCTDSLKHRLNSNNL